MQEAGRAGRDGEGAHCALFVDMSVLPTLLPSKGRTAAQSLHSQRSLREMYHYTLRCNTCRLSQVATPTSCPQDATPTSCPNLHLHSLSQPVPRRHALQHVPPVSPWNTCPRCNMYPRSRLAPPHPLLHFLSWLYTLPWLYSLLGSRPFLDSTPSLALHPSLALFLSWLWALPWFHSLHLSPPLLGSILSVALLRGSTLYSVAPHRGSTPWLYSVAPHLSVTLHPCVFLHPSVFLHPLCLTPLRVSTPPPPCFYTPP